MKAGHWAGCRNTRTQSAEEVIRRDSIMGSVFCLVVYGSLFRALSAMYIGQCPAHHLQRHAIMDIMHSYTCFITAVQASVVSKRP
jgi:hypothetical protein